MSRIQDILAKAERDGTAGRLAPRPVAPAAPAVAVPAQVEGTALPRRTAFPSAVEVPAPIARAAPRKAAATLHPSLVAAIAPHAEAAEQYRAIRTRLTMHEDAGPLRTVAVTSPGAQDGKSVTAANLALTMAQEHQRSVVLVDGNLRNPAIHALFAVERAPGLSEVLAGAATIDEALIHVPELRLTLLPSGAVPDYPTELLGSGATRQVLDALRERFDRIVIDLPGVAPLADVGTVAPLTDGILMVVRAGSTQRPALEQALATFEPDKVVGVVLNERA
jgi:capsular exopolysaccharide synthesis family protein